VSTKYPESCKKCQSATMPIDTLMKVPGMFYPVPFWRYECPCGEVWANDAQRTHNQLEQKRAYKKETDPAGMD
jgi:hypothetical protein